MTTPSLWAVSDSRISKPTQHVSERLTLIDEGQKIFSLPLICRKPGNEGFFSETYHTHSVGLAFAGDTLIGLNVASVLVPLLTNLCGYEESHIPSIEDIALLVNRIAMKYVKSLGSRIFVVRYEAAVMGYCYRQRRLRMFRLTFRTGNGGLVTGCDEMQLDNPSYVLLLGSQKKNVDEAIQRERIGSDVSSIQYSRAPKRVVESLVQAETYQEIGGSIQLGIATQHGFNPYAVLKPIEKGKLQATLKFVGVDFSEDIGRIGDCQVSMMGMA
jgi:hypothetical protein